MENKIQALIKAAGVNAEPFGQGWFERPWPCQHPEPHLYRRGSWTCVSPGATAAGGPAPSTRAVPAEEKKVEAKKESEESEDDMGFGLFD